MDITSVMQDNIASIRNAIDMTLLRKSMHHDSETVNDLLQNMLETSISMEQSVTPYKGSRIDIRI